MAKVIDIRTKQEVNKYTTLNKLDLLVEFTDLLTLEPNHMITMELHNGLKLIEVLETQAETEELKASCLNYKTKLKLALEEKKRCLSSKS